MKYIITLLLSVSVLFSESYQDHIFPVDLTIDSSAGLKFRFNWEKDTNSLKYNIYRKLLSDSTFGRPLAILNSEAEGFIDSTVQSGFHYEYKIENYQTEISAYNYVAAGVNIPLKDKMGILLLVSDNTDLPENYYKFKSFLATEMSSVHERKVPSALSFDKEKTIRVKEIIKEEVYKNPDIRYVMLVGNVPIPYSGNFSPDGHNDHIGAFPADVWYADLDYQWSDSLIDADSAAAPRQHNFPGDGKFDNYYLPSPTELIISRIDFRNLTDFPESESELLERYFEKNIRYRTGLYKPRKRAFLSDGFGEYGGFPATFAYNQFASLFDKDSITLLNMRENMSTGGYSMAYGCAPGGYNSIYLTLYSHDLAQKDYDAVFLSCFGSWLCDWDSENNLLRAAIASEPSILCSWFGNNPQIPLHNFGLGQTIGEQIYTAQNNKMLYQYWYNYVQRGVHLNLMGDPTLKLHHLLMPQNINAKLNEDFCEINWEASEDAEYYNIYKSNSSNTLGNKINESPVYSINYKDYKLLSGKSIYTVKAVKKIITQNGSYYEESTGIRDSIANINNSSIVIYVQNPIYVDSNVEILVSLEQKSAVSYTLFDLEGKTLITDTINQAELNHTFQINTNFTPGAYFLQIKSDNSEQTKKLVLIK